MTDPIRRFPWGPPSLDQLTVSTAPSARQADKGNLARRTRASTDPDLAGMELHVVINGPGTWPASCTTNCAAPSVQSPGFAVATAAQPLAGRALGISRKTFPTRPADPTASSPAWSARHLRQRALQDAANRATLTCRFEVIGPGANCRCSASPDAGARCATASAAPAGRFHRMTGDAASHLPRLPVQRPLQPARGLASPAQRHCGTSRSPRGQCQDEDVVVCNGAQRART
jgi:hypothetical protein